MTERRATDAAILAALREHRELPFENLAIVTRELVTVLHRRLMALRADGLINYTAGRGWHLRESTT